jgi:SAM-dependent methyltransferase
VPFNNVPLKPCVFKYDDVVVFGKETNKRYIFGGAMQMFNAEYFYNKVANKYNWFFSSRENFMENSLNQLKPILEQFNVKTVLDCSCGNGLQAIPLAKEGYAVDASDISDNMLKEAIEFAKQENVKINFKRVDFRELENTFTNMYDCVLSWGNSIPHLMTDEDIIKAVTSIYNRVNENGIAIIGMRNYDEMIAAKKRFLPMRINEIKDGFRYSILYVFDYLPQIIRFNIVYLIENIETGEKHMEQETVDYNPILRDDFISYLKEAGFRKINVMGDNGCYIAQK